MWTRRCLSLVVVVAGAACGDPAGPDDHAPGLRFVAGTGQTDTVDAALPQAVTVEVRDSSGRALSGLVVRFEPADTALEVATLTGGFADFAADTTDAEGRSGVLVRFGTRAGPAGLRASVPVYGWTEDTEFTVQPGAAVALQVEPSDTLVSVGATFALRASSEDRYGNARADAITYQSLDQAAGVSAAGGVTALSAGVARIVARVGTALSDTSRVDVVPTGTIAFSSPNGVGVVNLDGTGYRELTIPTADYQGRYPTWLGDTALVAMDGQHYGELVRVSLSGAVAYLVPGSDTVALEVWPEATRDGSWVYFGGLVPLYPTSGISLWRVHPDGTGLGRVSPPNAEYEADTFPSPSPDGTRVALATTRYGSFQLAVIELASGQFTPLAGVNGTAVRWSPVADTIAYLRWPQEEIWVVAASGGGARRVSPADRYYQVGMDWSPDGRWIIAVGGGGPELLEVATGRVVLLPHLPPGLVHPAWQR
jgi:hypothetical protein